MKKKHLALLIVCSVLLLDQLSKFLVKLNFEIGEGFKIFDWFQILFIENEGMAFGMSFGGTYGKLLLSLFRLVLIGFLIGFLHVNLKKEHIKTSFIVCLSLILAGAIGNMIDGAFYGLIFSDSHHQVASFLPEAGGYAGFLHGKVVDMLYFPLFSVTLPDFFPIWGGQEFRFFEPVFNIADSSICIGFILFLCTQPELWKSSPKKAKESSSAEEPPCSR